MPDEAEIMAVARAICCPKGCAHPPDAELPADYFMRLPCSAPSYRREAISAIGVMERFREAKEKA